jgi:site-specific DNA-methyltransferase (adenine-specific)
MSLPKPYYQDDSVVLYHGDCREIVPQLGKFDLLLTDPPYGIGFKYESYNDDEQSLIELISNSIVPSINICARSVIFTGVSCAFLYPRPNWICSYTWDTTATFGACGYSQHQPVLFYGKDIEGFGNVNGITKSDVLRFSGGFLVERNGHPCPKPVQVMKRAVARFSNERETVLDPFAGSGTTGRACKDLGRKCVMIEREERYCEIAAKRMAQEVLPL